MGYVAVLLELNYAKINSFRNLELLLRRGTGSSKDLPKQAKQHNRFEPVTSIFTLTTTIQVLNHAATATDP
jgi:hypothetical protein